jgi:hypothetical protein
LVLAGCVRFLRVVATVGQIDAARHTRPIASNSSASAAVNFKYVPLSWRQSRRCAKFIRRAASFEERAIDQLDEDAAILHGFRAVHDFDDLARGGSSNVALS